MTLQDFVVGERVEYILPRSPRNGRDTDWFLDGTIIKITKTRLVIKLDRYKYVRITVPSAVRKIQGGRMVETPEGIGGRKWSLERIDGHVYVMQGNRQICQVIDQGVATLLVTSVELWEAAVDAIKTDPIGHRSLEAMVKKADPLYLAD